MKNPQASAIPGLPTFGDFEFEFVRTDAQGVVIELERIAPQAPSLRERDERRHAAELVQNEPSMCAPDYRLYISELHQSDALMAVFGMMRDE